MVELKVDSDKLPKAEDLRSRYFLTTFTIAVSDQDIRFIQREAFLSVSKTEMNLSALLIMPAIQASRAAAMRAQAANAAQGAQAPAPAAAPTRPARRRPARTGGGRHAGRPAGRPPSARRLIGNGSIDRVVRVHGLVTHPEVVAGSDGRFEIR